MPLNHDGPHARTGPLVTPIEWKILPEDEAREVAR